MIRVILPYHLQRLARINGEVAISVEGCVTQRSIIDAVEARFPMLRGTIRNHATKARRPYLRFLACGEDLSHESIDALVPEPVADGREPFRVVGAMSGG
jgi:molybdopterin synthase sulfur carrier subunit